VSKHILGEPPAWDAQGWSDKVGVTVTSLGRLESVEEMELMRFQDLDAWREYQTEVFRRTNSALDTMNDRLLAEVVVESLEPPLSFPKIILGLGQPFTKFDVLEYYIYLHGVRHVGELEHARALVGLKGIPV
jgi:hypothetical protein